MKRKNILLFLWENYPLEAKYCHKYGDRLKQNVTERELIEGYFHRGYPYQGIVDLLFNLAQFLGFT